MGTNYINDTYSKLEEVAQVNAASYANAKPFPNIVFEKFFNQDFLNKVLAEFPDLSKGDAKKFDGHMEKKLAAKGEARLGEQTKDFVHYLNSEPFLKFLQVLTGVKETLLPDPYFLGGGLHEIKPGGLLKIHADFNKHDYFKLDRRLNILIYLNKDWQESYGGHFELWNRDMTKAERRILPTFNTLAIFSTTDFSYHGHPDPLTCPPDRSRKSVALYYYTNGRPSSEINSGIEEHTTLFRERVGNKSDIAPVVTAPAETITSPVIEAMPTQTAEVAQPKPSLVKKIVKGITPPILVKIGKKVLGR